MPILDYDDELSWDSTNKTAKQSIVGNAGAAIVGGKAKDAGAARDWATGETLHPYVRTVDALTGATGGVQVDIVGADNAALTTNPVVLSTITIPQASFLANKLFAMPALTPGSKKRWVGAKFTPLTTNSTAGTLVCGFISRDGRPQDGVNTL
jgi:hypothetical protein